jgi:hypothetical protein
MFERNEVRAFLSRVAGTPYPFSISSNLLTYNVDAMYKVFPDIYNYYWDTLEKVCERIPAIEPSDAQIPFSSYTLNVGVQSCCHMHVDGCNLAGGICLISPYGDYNWRKGGHLILHEPKVAIALPPGSFTLIPSALVSHENVPIASEEERRAFTAFSPANLFQWVENGFLPVPAASPQEKQVNGAVEWARQRARFPNGTPTQPMDNISESEIPS